MARESLELAPVPGSSPTYWLTRFVLLRLLGVLYAVAFLVAINQIIPLIGAKGLLPVGNYLQQVSQALGSTGAGFARLPSLFWLGHSDAALLAAAWLGLGLACLVVVGYANGLLLALLWALYLSFVHVGQEWYGYGWEIQLTETGFLAIFLCPLLDWRPFPRYAPPLPIIVLFRWLVLRVMLGAGLIKVRGDDVWRNSTALYYHFETQPLPGPLSRWQMWFAAMATPADYPWTLNLVAKLLHNDPGAVSLFASNPFPGRPPRYIRAVRYRYTFARPGNPQGQWWQRERVDTWLPPLSANDPRLVNLLQSASWAP